VREVCFGGRGEQGAHGGRCGEVCREWPPLLVTSELSQVPVGHVVHQSTN
jgi:hypothetical protein